MRPSRLASLLPLCAALFPWIAASASEASRPSDAAMSFDINTASKTAAGKASARFLADSASSSLLCRGEAEGMPGAPEDDESFPNLFLGGEEAEEAEAAWNGQFTEAEFRSFRELIKRLFGAPPAPTATITIECDCACVSPEYFETDLPDLPSGTIAFWASSAEVNAPNPQPPFLSPTADPLAIPMGGTVSFAMNSHWTITYDIFESAEYVDPDDFWQLQSQDSDIQYSWSQGGTAFSTGTANTHAETYAEAGNYAMNAAQEVTVESEWVFYQTCQSCEIGQRRWDVAVSTQDNYSAGKPVAVVRVDSLEASGALPLPDPESPHPEFYLKATESEQWFSVTATPYAAVADQHLPSAWQFNRAGGAAAHARRSSLSPNTVWEVDLSVPATHDFMAHCGPAGPFKMLTLHVVRAKIKTPYGDPRQNPNPAAQDPADKGANATNERVYGSGADPKCGITCEAENTPLAHRLRWRLWPGVGNQQVEWLDHTMTPIAGNEGKGRVATAEIHGLPPDNGDFGLKWVTVTFDFNPSISDMNFLEVFFPRDAKNHLGPNYSPPGVISRAPNWYHYWGQVLGVANHPNFFFDQNQATSNAIVSSAVDWRITIGPNAYWPAGNPPTGQRHINGFYATVLHEQWHRDHRIHNFTAHGGWKPPPADDADYDGICNREPTDAPGFLFGGWEAAIGTDPLVLNSTEDGANWAETQGNYVYAPQDWASGGSQWNQ